MDQECIFGVSLPIVSNYHTCGHTIHQSQSTWSLFFPGEIKLKREIQKFDEWYQRYTLNGTNGTQQYQPLLCTQSSIHRIQLVKIQSLTPRHEYNLLGPQHQKLHSIDLHYSVVLLASVDKSRGGGVKKCSSLFCSSSFFLLPLPQPWIFNGMNSNFGTPEKEGGNM